MRFFLSILIFLASCNEWNIREIIKNEPNIEVYPAKLDFGNLSVSANESKVLSIEIFNTGNRALNISNISLPSSGDGLSYVSDKSFQLAPQESREVQVRFHPAMDIDVDSYIKINSDDPDDPQENVSIIGSGLAPIISSSPQDMDFGDVELYCTEDDIFSLYNTGREDLIINGLYSSSGNQFFYDPDISSIPTPIIIEPQSQIDFEILYAPDDKIKDIGYLTSESNDPVNPSHLSSQMGNGITMGNNVDSYLQEETKSTDILFVIDNSCSMSNEQAYIASNGKIFLDELLNKNVDFQIGVITTDSPNLQGPILLPTTPDLYQEFENQIDIGIYGSGIEKGLEMTEGALGGSFGSVMRNSALLSIILVSDENDYSTNTAAYYTGVIQASKSNYSNAMFHSVIAVPGFSTCAYDFGYEYESVSSSTGGLVLDICTNSWGTQLKFLADASLVANDSFDLSLDPYPQSIEVFVDSVMVISGWQYDPITNTVIFDQASLPTPGALVEIEYELVSITCPN